ncbi:hypothetical protein B6N60_01134 [Richelia sinica FACHB-800]|uniref:Uncharacterized protein n=1 Tax=Richelia sinica FACHB-800 TaxID=1357546 RepID=A0A975T6S4_9NOST|nr:hypothetical protein B6N60_01134 [Richelia sinica FACHB-800]
MLHTFPKTVDNIKKIFSLQEMYIIKGTFFVHVYFPIGRLATQRSRQISVISLQRIMI